MSAAAFLRSRCFPAAADGLRNKDRSLPILLFVMLLAVSGPALADNPSSGLFYTNCQVAEVPWSIHIVRVERTNALYELYSQHAGGRAIGLSTLSAQIALIKPALGIPVAAVNGDFYQRERAYAGDPRGLQIMDGELISAPSGGNAFWLDAVGEPHVTNVASLFQVTWPDGSVTPFGLNEERHGAAAVLYTPALGPCTHTLGGPELILQSQTGPAWLPLRIGRTLSVTVKEIRDSGNTPLMPGSAVLSLGPAVAAKSRNIVAGAVLQLSTASQPALHGIKTAIGGGPVLVKDGRRQKIRVSNPEAYESRSMQERHPRAAIGWNDQAFFLVEVDGRQNELSVGMTLDELAAYMVKLGCTDAMTLDGGGSATLWYMGTVRNSPCDGYERNLANSLVVVRKKAKTSNQPGTAGD